jgi:hypothetical protein
MNFFEVYKYCVYLHPHFKAGVVELVDTLDLGSSAARCESSSLSARTSKYKKLRMQIFGFFIWGTTWGTQIGVFPKAFVISGQPILFSKPCSFHGNPKSLQQLEGHWLFG